MRASAGGPLQGLGVLVTRPAHQAQGLQQLIETAGGRAFLFPLLEIKPLDDPSRALPWIRDLARYDIAVFVSANAVEHGLGSIYAHGGTLGSIEVIAVGRATARHLEERGITRAAVPSVANSEGVLRLDTLGADRITGKRSSSFAGPAAEKLLAEGLRRRGAMVDNAEVYERAATGIDPKPLLGLWDRGEIGAVIVTSAAALEHLLSMGAGIGRERLLDVTLVVLSERLAARARQLGFRRPPLVATEIGDAGLFSTLTAWRTQQEPLDLNIKFVGAAGIGTDERRIPDERQTQRRACRTAASTPLGRRRCAPAGSR